MRKWKCTTRYEIEKPWTDTLDFGCEHYRPTLIVLAETRGQAKAEFAAEFEDLHFCDVLARVYNGDDDPDLPYNPYDLTDEKFSIIAQSGGWILYEVEL